MSIKMITVSAKVEVPLPLGVDYTQQELDDWLNFHLNNHPLQTLSDENPLSGYWPGELRVGEYDFPSIEDIKGSPTEK